MESTAEEFVEDFLEHHGVKGMKWGVRKAKYDDLSKNKRKKAKADFKAKTNRRIDEARASQATGKTKANFKDAKAKAKLNKGNAAAQKTLAKAKKVYLSEKRAASTVKYGKENAIALVASGIGALVLPVSTVALGVGLGAGLGTQAVRRKELGNRK